MVYNNFEYIAEFVEHHIKLVDQIVFIDHKSDYNLKVLDSEKITVYKSNHLAQFQSECINTVIFKKKLNYNFDWLLPLDIDEFLPFFNREKFEEFLNKHSNNQVISMTWRNGISLDENNKKFKNLKKHEKLVFYKNKSKQISSFVNLKKRRENFFVATGNHHIRFKKKNILEKIIYFKKEIIPSLLVNESLFHIIALNKDKFLAKINNYVYQMSFRKHIKGQGGWSVRNYPKEMNFEQLLYFVANFREQNIHHDKNVDLTKFEHIKLFEDIDTNKIQNLLVRIFKNPKQTITKQSKAERKYLKNKKDDTDLQNNLKWMTMIT